MFDYETRRDAIVTAAWKIWTNNGYSMDEYDREETGKSVKDAAANAYQDDMTDKAWLAATLRLLGHKSED
jgi:hypothetical protein